MNPYSTDGLAHIACIKKIRENTYLLECLSNNSHITAHVIRIKRYFSPDNQIERKMIIEGRFEVTSTHPSDFQNEGGGVESEPKTVPIPFQFEQVTNRDLGVNR
mgnify:CR=1 FL=1